MDYSDFPTEEKKLPLKMIGIIGGGVVIAAIIIIVVVRIISGPVESVVINPSSDASNQISCDNAVDVEACEANRIKNLSEENGDDSLCNELDGNAKDDCYWAVANEMADDGICKKIVDTQWSLLCKEGIYKAQALETKKESFCDKIEDEQKKTDCKDELAGPCTMYLVADEANVAQDKRICEKLDEEYVDGCKALVVSDDPDFDGLETSVEYLYGSDPDKKDTDSDGYDDGDELSAGYNPAGPGLLE